MFTRHLHPILLVFLTLFSCTESPEGPELARECLDLTGVPPSLMIAATSPKEFMLHKRIMEVIAQMCEVRYYFGSTRTLMNYRDKYMASELLQ